MYEYEVLSKVIIENNNRSKVVRDGLFVLMDEETFLLIYGGNKHGKRITGHTELLGLVEHN